MTIFKIYVYDRQLINYSDHKHNIDGYYSDSNQAEKDLVRASMLEPRQLILAELTDSTRLLLQGLDEFSMCQFKGRSL